MMKKLLRQNYFNSEAILTSFILLVSESLYSVLAENVLGQQDPLLNNSPPPPMGRAPKCTFFPNFPVMDNFITIECSRGYCCNQTAKNSTIACFECDDIPVQTSNDSFSFKFYLGLTLVLACLMITIFFSVIIGIKRGQYIRSLSSKMSRVVGCCRRKPTRDEIENPRVEMSVQLNSISATIADPESDLPKYSELANMNSAASMAKSKSNEEDLTLPDYEQIEKKS